MRILPILIFMLIPLSTYCQLDDCYNIFNSQKYIDAYLCFNAARMADNSLNAKSLEGMQQCEVAYNNLLDNHSKLIGKLKDNLNQFYFFDNRLALAYNGKKFGFRNKKGEPEIDFSFQSASNFDPQKGYAQVLESTSLELLGFKELEAINLYYLGVNKKRYSNPEDVPHSQTQNSQLTPEIDLEEVLKFNTSDGFGVNSENYPRYESAINNFNKGNYFNGLRQVFALSVNENGEITETGKDLRSIFMKKMDKIPVDLDAIISRLGTARSQIYFSYNKYGIGKDSVGNIIFIDKDLKPIEKLGTWTFADHFNSLGFARVVSNNDKYLIDTLGNKYLLAEKIDEITPRTKAFVHDQTEKIDSFPVELLKNSQIEIIQLDGIPQRRNGINNLPIGNRQLENLRVLSLNYCDFDSLPVHIGKLPQLNILNLNHNNISFVPDTITYPDSLQILNINNNLITYLPSSLLDLYPEVDINCWFNPLEMDNSQIKGIGRSNNKDDFTYSWIFYNARKFKPAFEYIQRAIEYDPTVGNWFYRSFMALFAKDPDDAILSADEAFKMSPSNNNKVKLKVYKCIGHLLNNNFEMAINLKDDIQEFEKNRFNGYLESVIVQLQSEGIDHPDFEKFIGSL